MELRPGHSYRIETPIVILPYVCPPPGDYTAAIDACNDANNLVQIPNCEFVVTATNECDLMCFGEPPTDPDPGGPADETATQALSTLGSPNMDPTVFEAGTDASDSSASPTPPWTSPWMPSRRMCLRRRLYAVRRSRTALGKSSMIRVPQE